MPDTSASRTRDGAQAIELGEDGRSARIEFDPRREQQWKLDGGDGRQRDRKQVQYGGETRQRAVDRVISDALLGGMADGGDALAPLLGLDEVVLEVRQRVQLRRLLGENQRSGDEQVAQSTVHVTALPG